LQILLLEQADLRRLFQCELGVFAIDAVSVEHTAALLYFNMNFDQIFYVHFARTDQRQNKGFVGGIDAL
jgi:hypothetical protein